MLYMYCIASLLHFRLTGERVCVCVCDGKDPRMEDVAIVVTHAASWIVKMFLLVVMMVLFIVYVAKLVKYLLNLDNFKMDSLKNNIF